MSVNASVFMELGDTVGLYEGTTDDGKAIVWLSVGPSATVYLPEGTDERRMVAYALLDAGSKLLTLANRVQEPVAVSPNDLAAIEAVPF